MARLSSTGGFLGDLRESFSGGGFRGAGSFLFDSAKSAFKGQSEIRTEMRRAAGIRPVATSSQSSITSPLFSDMDATREEQQRVRDFIQKSQNSQSRDLGFGGGVSVPTFDDSDNGLQEQLDAFSRRDSELSDAIEQIYNELPKDPELRSFEFDLAAEKIRQEKEINPKFERELNDFMKITNIERRRRREDFSTAVKRSKEKEGQFFRKFERQGVIDILAQRRSARIRGLGTSGLAARESGLLDIGRQETAQETRSAFEQAQIDREKGLSRFEETSSLEEKTKRGQIEESRKSAVEDVARQERERARQEHAEEQARLIAETDRKRQKRLEEAHRLEREQGQLRELI